MLLVLLAQEISRIPARLFGNDHEHRHSSRRCSHLNSKNRTCGFCGCFAVSNTQYRFLSLIRPPSVWRIYTQKQACGLRSQALRLFSDHLFSTKPQFYRQQLVIEVWNTASWKVAERSGFLREGVLRSCGFGDGVILPTASFIPGPGRTIHRSALRPMVRADRLRLSADITMRVKVFASDP